METIRKGYKQTDIGIIPEDWEAVPIGNALKIKHGKSQKGVESPDGKYPIFGTGGLMGYADDFLYDKESVLIGRKGTIDKPMYVSTPFWTVDTLFFSVILGGNMPSYLFYAFGRIDWYLYNEASGVPSLNAKTIEAINIPLPPPAEQRAIAEVLSDIDSLIEVLDKNIAKKRAIKDGAMQQLLTAKRRLPGFSDPWVEKHVKEMFEVTRGLVLPMSDISGICSSETPFPVYSSQTSNKGIAGYYKNYLFENSITWTTDGANAGEINFRKGKFYCTNICGVLNSDKGYANLCIAGILNLVSKGYVSYIGNPKLMNNVMADITVLIPENTAEQQAISKILSDMDAEIELLEQQRSKYTDLKQGTMQQLLTGQIRLR